MNSLPLISCIITTYKRRLPFVSRAINSVLEQTYKNIELIIVDDNHIPNDYSDEISDYITELGNDNVKYIKLPKNMGACAARNVGIDTSSGEFIAFLDDDDEWLPEKLEKQYEKMSDLQIGLVYCFSFSISENNKKVRGFVPDKNTYNQILLDNFIGSTSFPLIRKECFTICGKFDETLKSAQDYDMWIRILKNYNVDFVGIPLCNYYIHKEDQITKNISIKTESLEYVYKKYYEDIKKNRNINNNHLLTHSALYALKKQKIKTIKLLLKAFFICPWVVRRNTIYLLRSIKYFLK